MTPQLKIAIETVIKAYYKEEKKSFEFQPPNKRNYDHVFVSLRYLYEQVKYKKPKISPPHCWGNEELRNINEAMQKLNVCLDLNSGQHLTTKHLYLTILHELNTGEKIPQEKLNYYKECVIARIRNMTLTQNIS